ncbi:Ldh family oxidoreductase [Brevibacterium album]|uniref:Ldh family oxidoreductase n=1 Tax=Brevibacterium album TaxID=417948 RepID=UPI00146FAE53|nr:Ldh family oxidoreductase [Brevibacterium album]
MSIREERAAGDRRLTPALLHAACEEAVRGAGGSQAVAGALARATVAAERRGRPTVGAAHLLDCLRALRDGRLNGQARPRAGGPRAAVLTVDADAGPVQLAFESVREELLGRVRELGLAVLSVRNGFTAGELGHYVHELTGCGCVALAAANSPALMSVFGARTALTGTNPIAFGLPHARGPRVFDQATSALAWVALREAAGRGEAIAPGRALDSEGRPTTDAGAGLAGTLLPFGGAKGSNIAVMVELLAVLSGAAFSLDAPAFDSGGRSPGTGLFLLALDPAAFDPAFADRAEAHLSRLAADHGADFGRRREPLETIVLPAAVWEELDGFRRT